MKLSSKLAFATTEQPPYKQRAPEITLTTLVTEITSNALTLLFRTGVFPVIHCPAAGYTLQTKIENEVVHPESKNRPFTQRLPVYEAPQLKIA